MTLPADIIAAFTPTGRLRACINLGNPILAGQHATTGEVHGVSVDLARGFAQRLGVALELLAVDNAGKSVDRVTRGEALARHGINGATVAGADFGRGMP